MSSKDLSADCKAQGSVGDLLRAAFPWADAEFPPIDCNGFPLLGPLQARSSIEHDLQVLLPVEANAQLGLGIA